MSTPTNSPQERLVSPNFITDVIDADVQSGRVTQVVTRFPPEPNGYLHLGHTYASFLDFQLAKDYGGRYHLRLDDTNPEGESEEYAQGIARDLRWLGWDWGEHLYYASDYFEQYYAYAQELIQKGLAYVDSVSGEEMARLRGTVDTPGTPSPYRERSVEENLDLFRRMRAGEFPDGAHVLRAKIDLASPNFKLRDPVLYRILRAHHYRQGDAWCIYPLYDFQHPLQDAIEGVTHSLCSLEFVDNRAIYDWLMEHLFANRPRPHQYEFGRRALEYTVVSKRKLRKLVEGGHVSGWDDPRMPTIAALRRRGVTPEAVRRFAAGIGVSRTNRTVDIAVLEHAIRDDLNTRAPRVMAVLRPLRVVIENLPEGDGQKVSLPYWPHDVIKESPDGLVALPSGERVPPEQAVRFARLTREVFIEQEDFALTPSPGFKRLSPGGRVRLRGAGVIECQEVIQDDAGEVNELRCTLLPETENAKGVIHWVSASQALRAEFRLYDRLFTVPSPEEGASDIEPQDGEISDASLGPVDTDFLAYLNPDSLHILHGFVESSVLHDPMDTRYQFERTGYFWRDPTENVQRPSGAPLVFNRIITLRDSKPREESAPDSKNRNSRSERTRPPQPASAGAAPLLTPQQQAIYSAWRERGTGDAEALVLAREATLAAWLEEAAVHASVSVGILAGWVVNELGSALRDGSNRISPAALAQLVARLQDQTITARIAKEVLAQAQLSGEDPVQIVEREGRRTVSDRATLMAVVDRVMADSPDKVQAYRSGRTGLIGFFTGQVMRATGGQADPQRVAELLHEKLDT
ncbi:glutamine--tRNA ligase/YqeY domain fusion protein [Deinococcus peraridilitoris]|uniref:Glutamine--tRNA ligase n=1 Tax=Deinococcus peraridilitoris (strain DSM 19664 / LMG 22246 / CIP 109416 / KR-200) TaxID=937777 RepID=L0A2S1_DEIPD|nr:glutamine--tRNA ligase/YqeY domain fusion protein [Deinococcus peraridilitoris]AFZ68178.1 glutaminyl-tRNA synthetase [Deinococcus peraridilitoris DSM 19664]